MSQLDRSIFESIEGDMRQPTPLWEYAPSFSDGTWQIWRKRSEGLLENEDIGESGRQVQEHDIADFDHLHVMVLREST